MPKKNRKTSGLASILVAMLLGLAVGPIVLMGCFLGMSLYALTHESEYREGFVRRQIINSLKDIMYGLIYPAVLGTGLVLFVSHVAKEPLSSWLHDPVRYPAIAAGFFYILSFTALSSGEKEEAASYQWLPFAVDWIEVALMFACFYFLGLIDERATIRLAPAYGCLTVDVILVQPVWRLVAGAQVWTAFKARVTVAALLAVAMITVHYPSLHPWVDMLIALVVFLFVAFYIHRDVEYQKEQPQPR
jgi:hypothetical protein